MGTSSDVPIVHWIGAVGVFCGLEVSLGSGALYLLENVFHLPIISLSSESVPLNRRFGEIDVTESAGLFIWVWQNDARVEDQGWEGIVRLSLCEDVAFPAGGLLGRA